MNVVAWFRDFSLPGIFAPRSESSHWEPRTFAPGSENSRELSSQGANVPGNIRSAERRGANCTSNYKLHITHKLMLKPIYWRRCLQFRVRVNWEHSLPGTKVPGNFRSWERRFPLGTFAPRSENTGERKVLIPFPSLSPSLPLPSLPLEVGPLKSG